MRRAPPGLQVLGVAAERGQVGCRCRSCPTAGAADARAQQQRRRLQRAGGDDDAGRADLTRAGRAGSSGRSTCPSRPRPGRRADEHAVDGAARDDPGARVVRRPGGRSRSVDRLAPERSPKPRWPADAGVVARRVDVAGGDAVNDQPSARRAVAHPPLGAVEVRAGVGDAEARPDRVEVARRRRPWRRRRARLAAHCVAHPRPGAQAVRPVDGRSRRRASTPAMSVMLQVGASASGRRASRGPGRRRARAR